MISDPQEVKRPRSCFLAGPMRGIDEYNFPAFFEAALALEAEGVRVHNPASVDEINRFKWKRVRAGRANVLPTWARASCERAIETTDAVVVLPGWINSEGARGEVDLADSLGKPVLSYPSLVPISRVERDLASDRQRAASCGGIKLFVVGHGRHGKDTVGRMISEASGLVPTDSSWFAASLVVRPFLLDRFGLGYKTLSACYDDRHNHRAKWYAAIEAYNSIDPARLSRQLFKQSDIYVGIRNRAEFLASKSLADLSIWVDGSRRLPPESARSMTILESDCDITISNNGTVDHLQYKVDRLVDALGIRKAEEPEDNEEVNNEPLSARS